jgi:3-oxoacyl-[acyl-carrier protein] reductase
LAYEEGAWMKLQGRVALVTGASRGIGREIALALGRSGSSLALVARDEALLNEVAAQVGPERAFVVRADLAEVDEVKRAAEAVESRFGRVDVLVNNAGIVSGRDFLESEPDQLARTVDVNFHATVVLTRLVAEGMARRRAGHIVNIASLAGIAGMPGEPTYAGTKAALRLSPPRCGRSSSRAASA